MKTNKHSNKEPQNSLHVIEGAKETKVRYRKIVQAGIALWIKEFQAGNIILRTVDDLDKLIRMDLRLQRDSEREE